jgi:hypothetical protein
MNKVAIAGLGIAGAGVATIVGGGIYRGFVQRDARKLESNKQLVESRSAAFNNALRAVDEIKPRDPAGLSADDAIKIARERFGVGPLMDARTGKGDLTQLSAAQVGPQAFKTPGEASQMAVATSAGRATSVGQVGDWYVPIIMDDALAPEEHSRRVAYQETEYEYHHGYNRQSGEYEYHYGPHEVTRYRTEEYLSPYTKYTPEEFGIDQARTGGNRGTSLENNGTEPEQFAAVAQRELGLAQQQLESSERSVEKQDRAGFTTMKIGGGVLALGAALAAIKLLR